MGKMPHEEKIQRICYEIGLENFEKGLTNYKNVYFETAIYAPNIAVSINSVFYKAIFLRGLSYYMLRKYKYSLKDFNYALNNTVIDDEIVNSFKNKCNINKD